MPEHAMESKNCAKCGTLFHRPKGYGRRNWEMKKFCSRPCYDAVCEEKRERRAKELAAKALPPEPKPAPLPELLEARPVTIKKLRFQEIPFSADTVKGAAPLRLTRCRGVDTEPGAGQLSSEGYD